MFCLILHLYDFVNLYTIGVSHITRTVIYIFMYAIIIQNKFPKNVLALS